MVVVSGCPLMVMNWTDAGSSGAFGGRGTGVDEGMAMVVALAAVFAVINGANDGGAMLAAVLKVPGVRLVVSLATFTIALAIVPAVLGTGVADTLTSGLVEADAGTQRWLVAVGVVAATAVVAALTVASLPTSLTLAMVGGIVGAGIGRGLPVQTGMLGRVLLIGLAAPVVGGLLAVLVARLVSLVLAVAGEDSLATLHRVATVVQAVAYAANDGQKMFAVVAVTSVGVTGGTLAAVALLFALGAVLGVGAASQTLGGQILRAGPREEAAAQFAASAAVLASAALGAPVSMTQAVSGGLVGTGLLRGLRQVRWRVAAQLALAWIITLPSAAAGGAGAAWMIGRMT
jgi:PiT family inorganic phosphate transporter